MIKIIKKKDWEVLKNSIEDLQKKIRSFGISKRLSK